MFVDVHSFNPTLLELVGYFNASGILEDCLGVGTSMV